MRATIKSHNIIAALDLYIWKQMFDGDLSLDDINELAIGHLEIAPGTMKRYMIIAMSNDFLASLSI